MGALREEAEHALRLTEIERAARRLVEALEGEGTLTEGDSPVAKQYRYLKALLAEEEPPIKKPLKPSLPSTDYALKDLLGASVGEARKAAGDEGKIVRVVWMDGVIYPSTRSHVSDRINLWVEEGKVVAAYYG